MAESVPPAGRRVFTPCCGIPTRRSPRSQDIRVDGLHASSPIHQIEEFVAVEQIDARLLDGFPAAELDPDPLSRRRLGQRLPKQFIGDILKRATFPDRFFFQPPEKVVINSQGRSSHASRCRCKASRCQTGRVLAAISGGTVCGSGASEPMHLPPGPARQCPALPQDRS